MSTKLVIIVICIASLGLFAVGAYAGWHWKKDPPPCPQLDTQLVDSLRNANADLRVDSALQHTFTLGLKATIEEMKKRQRTVSQQVQDAYDHTRRLLPDSIARGLLADPPGLTE